MRLERVWVVVGIVGRAVVFCVGWGGVVLVFFFKQKTAYEVLRGLVGAEMCIRDG